MSPDYGKLGSRASRIKIRVHQRISGSWTDSRVSFAPITVYLELSHSRITRFYKALPNGLMFGSSQMGVTVIDTRACMADKPHAVPGQFRSLSIVAKVDQKVKGHNEQNRPKNTNQSIQSLTAVSLSLEEHSIQTCMASK
jgi:hypothetical protein